MQKFFLYAFLFIAGIGIGYFVAVKTPDNKQEVTVSKTAVPAEEQAETTEPAFQKNDVTMESYSDDGLDHAYITLKNNTTKTIREISFRLFYLDMQDNQLDYRDYTQSTEFASGLVKRFDIEDYDSFHYHYYKTEPRYGSQYTPYKIQYELLHYE